MSLSDKIEDVYKSSIGCPILFIEDVKEAVKKLKKEAEYFSEFSGPFIEVINKIFGDKLI